MGRPDVPDEQYLPVAFVTWSKLCLTLAQEQVDEKIRIFLIFSSATHHFADNPGSCPYGTLGFL